MRLLTAVCLAAISSSILNNQASAAELENCTSEHKALPIGSQTLQLPVSGTPVEAEVGQSVASARDIKVFPERLVRDAAYKGSGQTEGFATTLRSGMLAFKDTGPGGDVYAVAGEGSFKGKPLRDVGVVIYKNGGHGFWGSQAVGLFTGGRWFKDVAPAGAIELSNCLSPKDEFRRELIYSGRSGTTISLTYREFSDDMARPAFSQELRYDIGAEPEVGFRGARIRIIEASNTSLKYLIIAPLR